jgi:hypothetical protein
MEQDCRDFKDRLMGLWRLRVATPPSLPEHCIAWHAERSRLLLWLGEEGLARMLGNPRSLTLANAVLTSPQEAWAALLGCVAVVSSAQTWDCLGWVSKPSGRVGLVRFAVGV